MNVKKRMNELSYTKTWMKLTSILREKYHMKKYTVTGSFYMKSKSDKPICDRRQESSN